MTKPHLFEIHQYLKARAEGQKTPSPQVKFTHALLTQLPSDSKPYVVRDTEQSGLRVKVHPSGNKVVEVVKKVDGRAVTVRICRVGELPLTGKRSIRARVQQVLADLLAGSNPNENKRRAKSSLLADVLNEYIEMQSSHPEPSKRLAPATAVKYRQVVNKHAAKWLNRPLRDITPIKALELHQRIASPSQANYLIRVLRVLVNYTNDMHEDESGYIPIPNPARLITRRKRWHTETPRSRTLTAETLPAWWQAVESLASEQNGELWRDYMQCTLLMGTRMRELLNLRWDDVDLQRGTIYLRGTKTRDTELPVSTYVLNILKRRHKASDDEPGPFAMKSPRVAVAKVVDRSGIEFTLHDLRRTFASVGEREVSYAALKKLLNHAVPRHDVTLAHYIKLDTERLRQDTQRITDTLLMLAGVSSTAEIKRLCK